MEGWQWRRRWGGSLRWNHNLGQLKTDPLDQRLPKWTVEKKVAQLVPTQECFSSSPGLAHKSKNDQLQNYVWERVNPIVALCSTNFYMIIAASCKSVNHE